MNWVYFASLLAEEFVEFGSSGRRFNQERVLNELQQEQEARLTVSDFHARLLASDVALVTYQSTRFDAAGDVKALRSSVWILWDARWRMLFHQATKLP